MPGFEQLDDEGIIQEVMKESEQPGSEEESDDELEEGDEAVECFVTHQETMKAFENGLLWLQHQAKTTPINLANLRFLMELAAKKRFGMLKQTSIQQFFIAAEK